MKTYDDLELSILSCIVIKPELMEKLTIEDKYFVNHKRLVKFMRTFYEKYKCFDYTLMYTVCKDKYSIIACIQMLAEKEGTWRNFELYQERLKELYDQDKLEAAAKEEIYNMANKLICGLITLDEFKVNSDKLIEKLKECK